MARAVIMDSPADPAQNRYYQKEKTQAQGVHRDDPAEIAMLMCYEATRELPLTDVEN